MTDFDVQRATAIICRAQEAKWVGEGEMPEGDADRIVKAEEIVQAARQVEQFRDAWRQQLGDNEMLLDEKVPTWRDAGGHGAEAILMEANVLVGANESSNGASDFLSAPAQSGGEREPGGPTESAPPPPGIPSTDAHDQQSVVRDAEPHVSEPPAVAAPGAVETRVSIDPQVGEVWLDDQGTEWEVTSYSGGPMVEVKKVATGEQTVGPAGMLKTRVQESPSAESSPQQEAWEVDDPAPAVPTEESRQSGTPARPQGSPIVEHDASGDEAYEAILARVEERYTPSGFPLPHGLDDPPQFVPDDLDTYQEVQVQRLHSQYNALAALAKLRHDYEDAISRECQAALKLASQQPMRLARDELGKSSTLADRQAWAEEQSEEVALWRERVDYHAGVARAYQTFFDIYTKNVAVTSRDLEFRLRQLNS